ncbi:MAG: GNAT family N-acetyltransferase [Patescibacteria group bacterium]
MRIVLAKNKTPELGRFGKREWALVNPEHFGKEINWGYAKKKEFRFVAKEGEKILGVLSGHYLLGVMYIGALIVSHLERRRGVGIKLIRYAENYARKHNLHLIYLEAGADWQAVKFYRSLGYKSVFRFRKFFGKKDFLFFVKYLK